MIVHHHQPQTQSVFRFLQTNYYWVFQQDSFSFSFKAGWLFSCNYSIYVQWMERAGSACVSPPALLLGRTDFCGGGFALGGPNSSSNVS